MPSPTREQTPRPAARSAPRKRAASPAARPRMAAKSADAPAADGVAMGEPTLALELSAGPALLEGPTRESMIRARAFERYERNGCVSGRELDDWLAAEAEVGALMSECGDGEPSRGA